MEDNQTRRHLMFVRVKSFGADHADDFAPGGLGSQLFADLGGIVSQLENHASAEASSIGATKEGTTSRRVAREALREDLEAISRTARAMAEDTPGINEKFRLPRGNNDLALVSAGRAFALDAAPLSAQFISHELPGDFLMDLKSDISTMEAAMNRQSSGVGDRISAGVAIDEAIDAGMVIVRKLDAVVRNRYFNDPAEIAEWTSASHTERAPRHHHSTAPGQSTAGADGGSTPAA